MMEIDLDHKLLLSLKRSDQDAMTQLFQRYSDMLLSYGMTITRDRDVVKDCLQELFINIWNQRANITVTRSLKFYLVISLRRIILKKLKRSYKNSTCQLDDLYTDQLRVKDPEAHLIEQEQRQLQHNLLQDKISSLSKRQREVIHLRYYEELNFSEISVIMGLNYQGTRNILCKSIKTLRLRLADIN